MRTQAANRLSAAVTAVAAAGVTALLIHIHHRKLEGHQRLLRLVELNESILDAAVWGLNVPRQYDGSLRTSDTNRTRYAAARHSPIWILSPSCD